MRLDKKGKREKCSCKKIKPFPREYLLEQAGRISMCWKGNNKATFQAGDAIEIVDELYRDIEAWIKRVRETVKHCSCHTENGGD